MSDSAFEPKMGGIKEIVQSSPKWEGFVEWCKQGLVGKKVETHGHDFQGKGPLYRATITSFEIKDYAGGPQFTIGIDGNSVTSGLEKFNEETKSWEPESGVTLGIMGHVSVGARLEGDDLVIENSKILSANVPSEFFEK